MMQTMTLMPKIQLISDYTQDGQDAAWVGNADAVAFQFFVDGMSAESDVTFTIQHSTSKSDDEFVDTAITKQYTTAGSQNDITVSSLTSFAGFIRVKVVIGALGAAAALQFRVTMNLKHTS